MVHAVIHIICGNCGSTDLKYVRGDVTEDGGDSSALKCQDCATIHTLEEINERA